MTVNELIEKLQKLAEEGHGDNIVCMPSEGSEDDVKGAMRSKRYSNVVLIHNFTESDYYDF